MRLQALLDRGQQALAHLFHNRWLLLKRRDWEPGSPSAQAFFASGGEGWPAFQRADQRQREKLTAGKSELWDINLLTIVLVYSDWSSLSSKPTREKENEAVNALRKARNELAHTPPTQLSTQELDNLWAGLTTSLVALGEDEDQLRQIKRGTGASMTSVPRCSDEVLRQAKLLKEEANLKHRTQRFGEATQLYTDALALPLLPKEELAVLHSNRSASHLALGNVSEALQDGKEAQQLRPTWPKGYFRKGKALLAQNKYAKALEAFEWALALDPTNSELVQCVGECKEEIEKQDRYEHLNAEYLPKSEQSLEKVIATRGCLGHTPLLNGGREKMIAMFKQMGELGRAYVAEAHTYMMEPNLDYAKAARLFQLGVDNNSPEAMYNLAVLYQEGRGVKKDLKTSQKLLEQAVTHPPLDGLTKTRNLGVAESQHFLGKAYLSGLFGEMSVHKGLALIRLSADAGYGAGLNTLGALYQHGQHVERKNEKQAHEYYLAAAAAGDTVAMSNLASVYARGVPGVPQDLGKAKTWARRSVENGNMAAQQILEALESEEEHRSDRSKQREELFERLLDPRTRQGVERIMADMDELKHKAESSDTSPKTIGLDPRVLLRHVGTSRTAAKELSNQTGLLLAVDRLTSVGGAQGNLREIVDLVASLSEVYKNCDHLPRFPPYERDQLVAAVTRVLKAQPDHEGARLVWAGLHFYQSWASSYLEQCGRDFPGNGYFPKLHGWRLAEDRKWEEAAREYARALGLCPDDLDALYSLAAVQKQIVGSNAMKRKTIDLYKEFLSRCEPDHPKTPEAHYGIGVLLIALKDFDSARKHYRLGLEAEKKQLPMFLPYTSAVRDCLAVAFDPKRPPFAGASSSSLPTIPIHTTGPSSPLRAAADPSSHQTDKERTVDVRRNQIRLKHRDSVHLSLSTRQPGMTRLASPIAKPPKTQRATPGGEARLITVEDLDPTEDKVYNGCLLHGTIIEQSVKMVGLITVIEDTNGRAERLALYNLPEEVSQEMTIGQRISISNPYMRMAGDGKPLIRVDDPLSIKLLEKITICHFCTKPATKLSQCGKCFRSSYCSKACQVQDWKTLNHKAICG